MRIAVAGGTGLVGRMVVDEARAAGHEVSALSRAGGVDVLTGAGLAEALAGVATVIDVTNTATLSTEGSVAFFGAATEHLLAAEVTAGVGHHVVLSIVGIDALDSGYYAGKLRQEQLVAAGPVPWTVLRATQFHEFAQQVLGWTSGPVIPVPRMLTAPVAAREVAQELVRLAAGAPQGRAADLGGPETFRLPALVRRVRRARGGRHGLVVPVPAPGATGSGALLPGPGALVGKQTFAQWLAT
jgi:uncharacterized protein YbjT (DUF2867 family)